jgi:hypothetical protein
MEVLGRALLEAKQLAVVHEERAGLRRLWNRRHRLGETG